MTLLNHLDGKADTVSAREMVNHLKRKQLVIYIGLKTTYNLYHNDLFY